MADFKPAYLIHGDDHGRISERRARLRELAEAASGAQGVEVLEGEDAMPETIAYALAAMTFAIGRRFIIVEGAERLKEREMAPLVEALGAIAPDTTVAFFAREDSRTKAPKALHDAVAKAGGVINIEASVKPWELPKWVIARARELSLTLDTDAARTLIGHVGDRQQRILRELEKLALECGSGATLDAAEVTERCAASAVRRAWSLADAIVAGDAVAAASLYLVLRSQGERLPGLLYWMSQRVRVGHDIARALEAGQPASQIKRSLRMPSRAADALIADAERAGSERLRAAVGELADLELASRGGAKSGRAEDTEALLAIRRIAA
jgi:DNA polymerase III subunit delta